MLLISFHFSHQLTINITVQHCITIAKVNLHTSQFKSWNYKLLGPKVTAHVNSVNADVIVNKEFYFIFLIKHRKVSRSIDKQHGVVHQNKSRECIFPFTCITSLQEILHYHHHFPRRMEIHLYTQLDNKTVRNRKPELRLYKGRAQSVTSYPELSTPIGFLAALSKDRHSNGDLCQGLLGCLHQ